MEQKIESFLTQFKFEFQIILMKQGVESNTLSTTHQTEAAHKNSNCSYEVFDTLCQKNYWTDVHQTVREINDPDD